MATTPQPEVELAAAGDRCERLFAKAEAPGGRSGSLTHASGFGIRTGFRLVLGRGAKLV